MSYPSRDTFVSSSTSDEEKQRKLDEFATQKLSNYIAEDGEIVREDPPASPIQPAPTTKKSLKLKNTAGSAMSKTAKGNTPVKPATTEDEPPKRKSPRVAGRKRKIADGTTAEEAPSSPLTKKAKHVETSDNSITSPAADDASKPKWLKNLKIDGTGDLANPFATGFKDAKAAEESVVKPLPAVKTGSKRKALNHTTSDAEDAPSSPLAKKPKLSKAPINTSKSSAAPLQGRRRSQAAKTSKASSSSANVNDAFTGARAPAIKLNSTSTRSQNGISKKKAVTPEPDLDADESDSEKLVPNKKGKGKGTKNDLEVQFKEFENSGVAQASGKGHSTVRPDIENCTLDEPWKCGNRMCRTGMTWAPRSDAEKQGGVGRKACSHFFGRNKKETGYIHEDVWHWYCRKCYQRDQYKAKAQKNDPNGTVLTQLHLDFLRNQIVRLQLWRPDMTFTVQLTKRAQDRLAQFHKAIHRQGTSEAEAIAAVAPVIKQSAKGKDSKPTIEYQFDIKSIEHFDYTYTGRDKTFADLFAICDWIQALNDVGAAPCDPPIEFLPSALAEGETVVDPVADPDNYDRWAAYRDGEEIEENQDGSDDSDDDDDDQKDGDDEDSKDDDETIDAPLTDNDDGDVKPPPGIDEDDDEDDEAAPRPLPKANIYGATIGYVIPLGKRLGFIGKESLRQGVKCVEAIPMAVAEARQREKERLRKEQRETEEAAEAMLRLAEGADEQSEEVAKKEAAAHALMQLHAEDGKLMTATAAGME